MIVPFSAEERRKIWDALKQKGLPARCPSGKLDTLEAAFAQESQNLAFFTSTLSIFVTCAIGWLTTEHALTPTAHGFSWRNFCVCLSYLLVWSQLAASSKAKTQNYLTLRVTQLDVGADEIRPIC
ncbi:MAG: hypothetical protein NZ805_06695 [Armatimonadetes bacterium]|nr:hypothetical protein [Armatimonadota bacterium]MDW8026773.1 hypothetical protein [Armatimonadota bacterium]